MTRVFEISFLIGVFTQATPAAAGAVNRTASKTPASTDDLDRCILHAAGDVTKAQACRSASLAAENERLNTVLQQLSRNLSHYQEGLLEKSQRAWSAFRDANCNFHASQINEQSIGGPLGIVVAGQVDALNTCLEEQTRSRIKAIQQEIVDSRRRPDQ